MCLRFLWPVVVQALAFPAPAHADGAWRNYLRPTSFSGALAEGDTVWCASRDAGLVKYRPASHSFSSFVREPNGLASNRLSSIVLDRSRRMWLGTYGAGASVLSSDRERWALVNVFDGLPSDSVNALTADGDSMWIATTRGIAVYDGHEVTGILPDGVNPSPFASDNITGIVRRGDTVWVATGAGIYRSQLSLQLLTWARQNTGLQRLDVDVMISDGETLFALAGFVSYRYDAAAAKWIVLGGAGGVFSLSGSRRGVFACGTSGLFRWGGSGWTLLNPELTASVAGPMIVTSDAAGQLYAMGRPGSLLDASGTGIYVRPSGGAGTWSLDVPPGPPGNSCLNVDQEGDRVYVTCSGAGIGRLQSDVWKYWYSRPIGNPSTSQFFRPSFPYAMLIDKQSYKWFFCWAPLQTGATCVPDTGVLDILTDGPGGDVIRHTLLGRAPDAARWSFARASTADSAASRGRWFGLDSPCADQPDLTPAGLLYFKQTGTGTGTNDTTFIANYNTSMGINLPSNLVLSLTTDRTGRVWAGTPSGLCYFMPDSLPGQPPVVHKLDSTSGLSIRALVARRDTLWLFASGGLYQYSINTGGSRGIYDIPAGPSLQAVRPMDVGLDGTLWLGTANGVGAYRAGRNRVDYTSANSPLADNDVRSIHVDRATGYVWIATAAGLSRFNPGFVSAAERLPSLTLKVYPNPARLTALGASLRVRGNGSGYTGAIYDLNGRHVTGFNVRGNDRPVWDGSDESGNLVRPGIYFLRAESGGRSAVVRVVLLR